MNDKTQTDDIVEITESAVAKIAELIKSRERGALAVRVVKMGRLPGGNYQTEFKLVDIDTCEDDDTVQDTGSFLLYLDPDCAESIRGAKVDFDEEKFAAGFNIEYFKDPNYVPPWEQGRRDWEDPTAIAVQKVIDDTINPGVASHDGWVLLLDVQDETAFIEMGGGCQGCGIADITLKNGIETMIMQQAPQIKKVIDRTEHADGKNPYYMPSKTGESPFE